MAAASSSVLSGERVGGEPRCNSATILRQFGTYFSSSARGIVSTRCLGTSSSRLKSHSHCCLFEKGRSYLFTSCCHVRNMPTCTCVVASGLYVLVSRRWTFCPSPSSTHFPRS